MSELVKVRYLHEDEVDKIIKLESSFHRVKTDNGEVLDKRAWSRKDLIDFISIDDTRVIVVDSDSAMKGFLCFQKQNEIASIVSRLIVEDNNDEYRLMLLNQAMAFAKKAYTEKLVVYVYETDDNLIKFLSGQGFKAKLIRNRTCIDGTRFDELEFSKKVSYEN